MAGQSRDTTSDWDQLASQHVLLPSTQHRDNRRRNDNSNFSDSHLYHSQDGSSHILRGSDHLHHPRSLMTEAHALQATGGSGGGSGSSSDSHSPPQHVGGGHNRVYSHAFDPYEYDEGDDEDRASDGGSDDEHGYVKEVVSNSWGLDVTQIKCPVCQDALSFSEWTKYVDQTTLTQYKQYNQPYRSFSRFCGECEHEQIISQVNRKVIDLPARDLMPYFEKLAADLKAILIQAGLTVEDSSLSPVSENGTDHLQLLKSKQRKAISERDEIARNILQKFTDDTRIYCGFSQGQQSGIAFKAQSYLSHLTFRTVGQPFTAQPSASSSSSGASTTISQQHSPPSDAITSSTTTAITMVSPSRTNVRSVPILMNRSPGTFFQRRQHAGRHNGVFEMYKTLMESLLDLFDLRCKETGNGQGSMPSEGLEASDVQDRSTLQLVANVGDSVQGQQESLKANDRATDETNTQPVLSIGTIEAGAAIDELGPKRKIALAPRCSQSKRTRITRPGVVTRAESHRQVEIKRALVKFSKQLSSFETRQDQWKEIQFLHVRWLRWEWWLTVLADLLPISENCNEELCLQCGVSSHHESLSCFDHMRSLIAGLKSRGKSTYKKPLSMGTTSRPPKSIFSSKETSTGEKDRPDQDANTIQWKLLNTSPCPNCCILIHRDDGCNKVDCMLCGHRFCWICRQAWGVGCGFFRCGRQPLSLGSVDSTSGQDVGLGLRTATGENQVLSLAVSHESPVNAEAGPTTTPDGPILDPSPPLPENPSVLMMEKPEIGVPNVFVIHTKRSKA
ncbi:Ankyrin repeat and IBR domain-containing protein 1 [Mortierella claussenii]|nr:Ankyrin repeat and IBR domain-containing protein 1 [Mortierella claussenii]